MESLMYVTLWILDGLLAVAFLGAGAMKLMRSREELAASGQGWAADFSKPAVKGIGSLEVLAAVGLVVPLLIDVAPVLTPLAAVGAALLMTGATLTHLRRHEPPVPAAILAVVAAVAAVLGFLEVL
jgi:uncharacterized membrane protein YphA (DoxX/SURF4 family)